MAEDSAVQCCCMLQRRIKMEVDSPVDFTTLINNLANAADKDEIYKTIIDLDIIVERKSSTIRDEILNIDLGPFLKQLNSLARKSKNAGVRLVGKIFDVCGSTKLIAPNIHIITEALHEGDELIKLMYLKQLAGSLNTPEGRQLIIENIDENQTPLVKYIIQNVAGESLGIAKEASTAIQNGLSSEEITNHFLTDSVMNLLRDLLLKGSVVRFRVYQLFVDLIVQRSSVLQNANVKKIIGDLMCELDTDDFLTQLNCLEMLSQMAVTSKDGLQFIANSGILEKAIKVLKDVDQNPLHEILVPGAIKFFGSIARTLPEEILMRYPDFVEFIFSRANGEDPVLMVLCIETITNICSTEKGLKILYQNPEKLNNVIQIIAKVIQSALDEVLKLRVLDSLSSLFEEFQDGNSADNSLIKESLYKHLGQNPIEVLMNCSKQPFPDIRNGSFKVLASISRYSWSEQDMALAPGFLEFMLNRQTEQSKEGRELKFFILKTLSQSTTSKDNFGLEYYKRMEKYVQEGPFYSEQQTAVEYEES